MKVISIIILFFYSTQVSAQSDEQAVSSKISEVTVYLQGAQVTRAFDATVPSGNSTLVIGNLPANILERSIQVKSYNDGLKVLAVSGRLNYLDEKKKSEQLINLENKRDKLKDQIDDQQIWLEVYKEEASLLISNKAIGGTDNGVDIEELKQAAVYYRERLAEIKMKELELNRKIRALKEELTKVSAQLNELSNKRAEPVREVLVKVSARAGLKSKFILTYLVQEAGWLPSYDIRAENVLKPVEVTYKANVQQNTGEDWDRVKLTFSNADPSQSGIAPNLTTWYLGFNNQVAYDSYGSQKPVGSYSTGVQANSSYDYEQKVKKEIATTAVVKQTTLEFTVDEPYTIKSDGRNETIDMVAYDLPATYHYYAAPKLDTDVFLKAQVTDWEDYNFLAGEANLFFEGKFIGKTVLDTRSVKDTLNISLGRDKNIVITREKVKDFCSAQFIGSNRKELVGFEIKVRNKKQQLVDITIEDQVPVSTNKDIQVDLLEYSNADYNKVTGNLRWKLKLDPGDSKQMELKYEVKYPKDQRLVVD